MTTKELLFNDLKAKIGDMADCRPDLAAFILTGQTSFVRNGEAFALKGSLAAQDVVDTSKLDALLGVKFHEREQRELYDVAKSVGVDRMLAILSKRPNIATTTDRTASDNYTAPQVKRSAPEPEERHYDSGDLASEASRRAKQADDEPETESFDLATLAHRRADNNERQPSREPTEDASLWLAREASRRANGGSQWQL